MPFVVVDEVVVEVDDGVIEAVELTLVLLDDTEILDAWAPDKVATCRVKPLVVEVLVEVVVEVLVEVDEGGLGVVELNPVLLDDTKILDDWAPDKVETC